MVVSQVRERSMEELEFEIGLAYARRLDSNDDLSSFREAFLFVERDLIYFDGNSLGWLPYRTVERMHTVVNDSNDKMVNQ
jgi:kynureninase